MNKLIEVTETSSRINNGDIGFMYEGHFVNITRKEVVRWCHTPLHNKIDKATLCITYPQPRARLVTL